MGSCVSIHKDPESIMKLCFSIRLKNDKLFVPSQVKEKQNDTIIVGVPSVANVAVDSRCFPDAGSKDEAFFDSQPWLESDCEDDFYSVNGDLTPSSGSTPLHNSFTLRNLFVNKEETIGSVPEPSSPDKKKRLSELFKESLRGDEYAEVDLGKALDETNGTGHQPKSTNGDPRPPPGASVKDESLKSPQCCLPKLLSSRSFSERRRKTSPTHYVG